jgi:pSer/pThr/pTyr-binding forkhead associated (FHA) protein
MLRRPNVIIVSDNSLAPHSVAVEAVAASWLGGDTLGSTPAAATTATRLGPAPGGFLIVDGRRHVPLTQPVLTIGRRLDNQIILDDTRVSRVHAQIRQRYGRWVLYDLGSRGGTQVNGEPIVEYVLRPGDVISLAGMTLIYGEDERPAEPPGEDTGHTLPLKL